MQRHSGGMKMNDSQNNNTDHQTLTLTLDSGEVIKCMILTVLPVNGKEYIALLPLGEDGEPDPEAETYLYRFINNGPDKDPELRNIDDEEEFNQAADAFSALMEDAQ